MPADSAVGCIYRYVQVPSHRNLSGPRLATTTTTGPEIASFWASLRTPSVSASRNSSRTDRVRPPRNEITNYLNFHGEKNREGYVSILSVPGNRKKHIDSNKIFALYSLTIMRIFEDRSTDTLIIIDKRSYKVRSIEAHV